MRRKTTGSGESLSTHTLHPTTPHTDLVGLDLDAPAARAFIDARTGRTVSVDGVSGTVDTFIIEPFVPHAVEYYLSIQSTRDGVDVSFSEAGGVEVEANWDALKSVAIHADPTSGVVATPAALAPLVASLPPDTRTAVSAFIAGTVAVFNDLDFSLIEMNPFTMATGVGGAKCDAPFPFPLDMRGELDDTASFRSAKKWGAVEFPLPFGRTLSSAEADVREADAVTGASLKLTVLNPAGRVWTMVAGGGASVIYADTVADLGAAAELGNYAEYSGAPSEAETYSYAKTLLSVATASPDGRGRALLVGGGIANFTDVAATFRGIIRALREGADAVKKANMKIYVRRGGPNYAAGLAAMRALGGECGLDVSVSGPEATMTGICKAAIDWVTSFDT